MAEASARGSLGATVRPFAPSSIISAMPPILLAKTGRPRACASWMTSGGIFPPDRGYDRAIHRCDEVSNVLTPVGPALLHGRCRFLEQACDLVDETLALEGCAAVNAQLELQPLGNELPCRLKQYGHAFPGVEIAEIAEDRRSEPTRRAAAGALRGGSPLGMTLILSSESPHSTKRCLRNRLGDTNRSTSLKRAFR